MITNRIFRALMIVGMMIISTTIVEAQRFNREALPKLSQGGQAGPAATVRAPAPVRNVIMEPATAVQEANQGGLLDIAARASRQRATTKSGSRTSVFFNCSIARSGCRA